MDYLVTAVTFVIFFVEAMMHYNIGINAADVITEINMKG